jgi:hypothetical protein
MHGKRVISDTIQTSGKPLGLRLWVDDLGIRPRANDLVFVRAAIVDGSGTICTDETTRVEFVVTGQAKSIRSESVVTEMGVASMLVRTSPLGHRFSATAKSKDGLRSLSALKVE